MRISNAQTSAMMHATMNRNTETVARLQSQIGSGLRIQLPSDDPIASGRLLRIQREQASLGQYTTTIGKVSDNLKIQEVHLQSSADALGSVRDLLLWASNGNNSGKDLSGMATQLSGLEQSLVSFFNARDEAGNYLFSGTQSDTPAVTFDKTAGTYAITGNDERRQAVVGNGVMIQDNITASAALGPNADVLSHLHMLGEKLKSSPDDPATRQALKDTFDKLDTTHNDILGAITDLGGRQNTLSLLEQSNADVLLANKKVEGDLAQLDMGDAFLQVKAYEMTMQASQKVYSRVANISLFDLM